MRLTTLTSEEKRKKQYEKQIERAKAAKARQIERQREKMNNPEYQAEQREKQRQQQIRARERMLEKQQSAEYKEKQKQKAIEQAERAKAKQSAKPAPKKKASKGLKGRAPTAEEKRIMDALCQLPCVACLRHGQETNLISFHHIDGRTKPLAHAKGIPLCAHHHDTPADKLVIEKYPYLVPVHARGTVGGKAQFNKHNGTELELLKMAYSLAGIEMPEGLLLPLNS